MPKYVVIIFVLALATKAPAQELSWHKEVYKGNTFDVVVSMDTSLVIDPDNGIQRESTSSNKTVRVMNGDTLRRNSLYKDMSDYPIIDTEMNNVSEIIMNVMRSDFSSFLEDATYHINCQNIVIDANGKMVYYSMARIDSFYYSKGSNSNVILEPGKKSMIDARIRSILEKQKFRTLVVSGRPVPYTFTISKAIMIKDHDITELN